MAEVPGAGPQDVVLALTTLSFDIAILELVLPLTVGARVIIVDSEVLLDPKELARVIARSGVTIMQATPTVFRMLLNNGWNGRRGLRVLCGGEPLDSALARQMQERCGEVWNMYGPTEATVWLSTVWKVESGEINYHRSSHCEHADST